MIQKKNIRIILLRVLFIGILFSVTALIWSQLETYKKEVKVQGGSLHEGLVGTPRFINPVLAQSSVDHDLTRLLFSPLLEINTDSINYVGLEDIDVSDDKTRYTLFLKRGQKFHDGRTMTSQDVAFTIAMIQDPLIKSPLSNAWQGVEVEIIDNNTITLIISRPFNDFLYNLELGILPKHIWENINPQEFIFSKYNIEPVGSGPYEIRSIKYDQNGIPTRHTLKRSKESAEKAYLDTFSVSFFDNEDILMRALSKGTVQSAYGLSTHYLHLLPKSSRIYSDKLPRVFGIFFNQEKQELFRSAKVREALTKAIDKKKIIDDIFLGYAHSTSSAYPEENEGELFNREEAQELLHDEGWRIGSDGFLEKIIEGSSRTLSFDIAIPNTEEIRLVAEAVQEQLEQIGVRTVIRAYDQGNLNQNIIRTREYESLLFGYEVERPSDVYAFWHSSQISDPGLNISLLKNVRVDVLLERLRNEGLDDMSELNTLINESFPALFLYVPSYVYVLPEKAQGVELSLQSSEERFNTLTDWYIKTRKVWPLFIKK